jgi:hypothetical protein
MQSTQAINGISLNSDLYLNSLNTFFTQFVINLILFQFRHFQLLTYCNTFNKLTIPTLWHCRGPGGIGASSWTLIKRFWVWPPVRSVWIFPLTHSNLHLYQSYKLWECEEHKALPLFGAHIKLQVMSTIILVSTQSLGVIESALWVHPPQKWILYLWIDREREEGRGRGREVHNTRILYRSILMHCVHLYSLISSVFSCN